MFYHVLLPPKHCRIAENPSSNTYFISQRATHSRAFAQTTTSASRPANMGTLLCVKNASVFLKLNDNPNMLLTKLILAPWMKWYELKLIAKWPSTIMNKSIFSGLLKLLSFMGILVALQMSTGIPELHNTNSFGYITEMRLRYWMSALSPFLHTWSILRACSPFEKGSNPSA